MSQPPHTDLDPDAYQLMVDAGEILQAREHLDEALVEAIAYEGSGFPIAAVRRLAGMIPELEAAQAAAGRMRVAVG